MSRDISVTENPFFRAALAEAEGSEAILQWIQDRAEVVHANIEAHDILRNFGVKLKYGGSGHEEQISCPFHGKDNHPSCRVYPRDARSPSHSWCYTCQEWLDSIGMWRKFRGLDKYTHALTEIERAYGITPPEPPLVARKKEAEHTREELEDLYDVTERRLFHARESFSMVQYLTIGSVLDRTKHQMDGGNGSPETVRATLRAVLNKIGEKVRSAYGEAVEGQNEGDGGP